MVLPGSRLLQFCGSASCKAFIQPWGRKAVRCCKGLGGKGAPSGTLEPVSLVCVHAQALQSCPPLATLWTVACHAPLSMEAPGKTGLPCCPPGGLPDPGIEPVPPASQAEALPPSHQGSPRIPWAPSISVPVSPTSSCQDHLPNLSQGRAADGDVWLCGAGRMSQKAADRGSGQTLKGLV